MPSAKAPACLEDVLDEIAVMTPDFRLEPQNQHKARFKNLLEQQKKKKSSGSAQARIGSWHFFWKHAPGILLYLSKHNQHRILR